MALIDMIPPEYWRQMRKELNSLDWQAIDSAEAAARQLAECMEHERLVEAYERKRRQLTEEQKERKRQYNKAHYRKLHPEVKRRRF